MCSNYSITVVLTLGRFACPGKTCPRGHEPSLSSEVLLCLQSEVPEPGARHLGAAKQQKQLVCVAYSVILNINALSNVTQIMFLPPKYQTLLAVRSFLCADNCNNKESSSGLKAALLSRKKYFKNRE